MTISRLRDGGETTTPPYDGPWCPKPPNPVGRLRVRVFKLHNTIISTEDTMAINSIVTGIVVNVVNY